LEEGRTDDTRREGSEGRKKAATKVREKKKDPSTCFTSGARKDGRKNGRQA
jgi:hypothetical protein